MSVIPQTPPKALPGAYIQTPAFNKFQTGAVNQPAFRSIPAPLQHQQNGAQVSSQALSNQSQQMQTTGKSTTEELKPIERAAKTINEVMDQESRYPELDSYVGRECSQHIATDLEADVPYRRYLFRVRCLASVSMGSVPEIEDVRYSRQNI